MPQGNGTFRPSGVAVGSVHGIRPLSGSLWRASTEPSVWRVLAKSCACLYQKPTIITVHLQCISRFHNYYLVHYLKASL
jgi:hypothetical protein